MIEDFIDLSMESFDDIDTSNIDEDNMDDESLDFFNSIGENDDMLSDIDMDNMNKEGFCLKNDMNSTNEADLHSSNKTSSISFTGNGRCTVCSCGAWAGFGDTCQNCGHFYNKHV